MASIEYSPRAWHSAEISSALRTETPRETYGISGNTRAKISLHFAGRTSMVRLCSLALKGLA